MGVYRIYQKLVGTDKIFADSDANVQVTGEAASALIYDRIRQDRPVMIGRFGSNELSTVLNYDFTRGNMLQNAGNLVKGIPFFSRYKSGLVSNLHLVCGFFPITTAHIDRFAQMYIEDAKYVDVLGSWLGYEKYVYRYMSENVVRINLEDLSPFTHQHPWSKALEGKKVLVVHPFEESIKKQYLKRELLFQNKDVLPEFELKTVKAVQSYADAETPYKTWFDALDHMTEQISNVDFDIALLGCGGYGMPLAARIKRMGGKAIHIGGALQCMFGIKGKRWELPYYNYQNRFYNEHWVRPTASETPEQAVKVEGATYW